MLSHLKMLLVSKFGISGVLSSYMMMLFGGMLLLDSNGSSDMLPKRVGMPRQPLMMTYPL